MYQQRTSEYKYTQETKQVRSNTPQTRERYQLTESSIEHLNTRQSHDTRNQKMTPQIIQFLMACEIERLGSENEKLKFRIKEIQDNKQDRLHLEQQIIDLTNRLNEMTMTVETYQYEKSELITQTITLQKELQNQKEVQNQLYENRITNLLNEIESLTEQLREFDSLKLEEMQQLRSQIEYDMKNEIEKEVQKHEMNSQYQREFLEGELKKWKDLCNQKQKENDDLKNVIQQKEQNKQRELENQLQSYKNEIDRVNKLLTQKSEDTENWKSKYLKLQLINDDYQRLQMENETLDSTIDQLSQKLENTQGQLQQAKQQIENANNQTLAEKTKVNQLLNQLQDTDRKKLELENRYKNLLVEIDKFKETIKNQETFTVTQTTKIEEYKSTVISQRSQIEDKSKEIENLRKHILKLQQQIEQMQLQIEDLKRFQQNCRILSAEIDRLNEESKVQEQELRQWRMQYADQGSFIKKLQDQLCIIVVLISEVESMRSRLQEKEDEIEEVRRSSLAPYKI